MEKSKIEMFLMMNGKNLPTEKLPIVKETLEKIADDKAMFIQSISFKDNTTAIILCILGFDRIYLGQVGLGILKAILMFFLIGWIWWFIDLFSISKRTKDYNFQQLSQITAYS